MQISVIVMVQSCNYLKACNQNKYTFFSCRQTDVTLSLKDTHYPDHDLGSIFLSVLLAPREEQREAVIANIFISVTTLVAPLWLNDLKHKNK